MFDVIDKAKRVGIIVLEHIEDYLELFRLDFEIQQHNFIQKALSFAITGICSLIAFIFFGFAIVVSFWETQYRILAAWCVVIFYASIATIFFFRSKKHVRRESAFSTISHELKEDIKLIKDLL